MTKPQKTFMRMLFGDALQELLSQYEGVESELLALELRWAAECLEDFPTVRVEKDA